MASLSTDELSAGVVSRRMAGRLAISSGIAGLFAFAFLIAALVGREAFADERAWRAGVIEPGFWDALFRMHDVSALAQAVLMIPVVRVLHAYVLRPAGWNLLVARVGVAAYTLLALTVAMIFVTHGSDMLYMIPQAFVGAWMVAVNRLQPGGISRGVRWLGVVAGIGLLIVGLAVVGIAAALGPWILAPVGPLPSQTATADVASTLNEISHAALDIGTLLGVLTYPVWSMLTGWALLKSSETVAMRLAGSLPSWPWEDRLASTDTDECSSGALRGCAIRSSRRAVARLADDSNEGKNQSEFFLVIRPHKAVAELMAECSTCGEYDLDGFSERLKDAIARVGVLKNGQPK